MILVGSMDSNGELAAVSIRGRRGGGPQRNAGVCTIVGLTQDIDKA